jgi:hypothetical protein
MMLAPQRVTFSCTAPEEKMIRPRQVLLLEIDEITWSLVDPLIQQGKLPTVLTPEERGNVGGTIERRPSTTAGSLDNHRHLV